MEFNFKSVKILTFILLLAQINLASTLPADNVDLLAKPDDSVLSKANVTEENSALVDEKQQSPAQNDTKSTQESDLETSESKKKEHTVNEPLDGSAEPTENEASASNFDPSIYGGLITPDAFQQYVNQFGAAFPYAAPYPAPVYTGYVPPPPPPVYPSPYVVQTGYEGYLVPTDKDSRTSGPVLGEATASNPTNDLRQPIADLSNIISTLLMSTLFKIIAGIVSAIGMVFFSGAIMNFMCYYTPLCDMSYRAINYLRRSGNAKRMGPMVAEGITPERVKRASEFVKNAIKLYQDLQETMATNESKEH